MKPFRYLTIALLAGMTFLPIPAQSQDDDGENFLTRLLQDKLSSAGRDVDITGFRGALSSTATMEKMTIADDQGIWLTLEGAELDWSRAALLRGRLNVNALTADRIVLERLPQGDEPSAPSAEATPFSIPDLPVAINVGEINAREVVLGESILGEAATLSLTGAASLADGGADVSLNIDRQDSPGHIELAAAYAPDSKDITLNLSVDEPAEGLISGLMGLPGRPSVKLTVAGSGPLDDYRADINLLTDGEPRLQGAVTLNGDGADGLAFGADIGGDITALFLPEYRDFFGPDVGLTVNGTRAGDGALTLRELDLTSASVRLNGEAAIGADGKPQSFDLSGDIADTGGERVTLPGTDVSLDRATLAATFDANAGEAFSLSTQVAGFAMPGYAAEALDLGLNGTIATEGTLTVGADMTLAAQGLQADDPDVTGALGTEITGGGRIDWAQGAPLRLTEFRIDGASYGALLNATVTPGEAAASDDDTATGTTVEANARLDARDLSAFAPLTGLALQGQAALQADFKSDVMAGTFSLGAAGTTEGIALGIEQVDPLLAPPATLRLAANRTAEGISLETFEISNDEISLTASGKTGNTDGRFVYAARLENSGVFTGAEGGPLALEGSATQTDGVWTVEGSGGGTDLRTGIEQADLLLAGRADLGWQLTAGEQILLEDLHVTTPQLNLTAVGELTEGARALTTRLRMNNSALLTGGTAGPLELTATARQAGANWRITANGGGTNIGTGIDTVDGVLRGRTDLDIDVVVGSVLTLNKALITNPQLRVEAGGDLTSGAREIDLTARLANTAIFTGGTAGPLELTGSVAERDGGYDISLDGNGTNIGIGNGSVDPLLTGQSDITLRARFADGLLQIDTATFDGTAIDAEISGQAGATDTALTLQASIDNVGRITPELSGGVTVAGDVTQVAEGYQLNLKTQGPGSAGATVAGVVGKPDGSVGLTINGTAPLALANGFIAPQSVTGNAAFDLTMSGQPGLSALSGSVTINGSRVVVPSASIVVEDLGGRIGLSGGQANVDLSASVGGGEVTISGPVGLAAPFNAGLTIASRNVVVEQLGIVKTSVNSDLTIKGGLLNGGTIAGRVGLRDTEIRVPAGGLGGVEAIPDVTHVAEPSSSRTTRKRAGLIDEDGGSTTAGGGGGGAALGLNVQVVADEPIFIRGRGLDAELSGKLRVGGTTADIRPVGTFNLERGRLSILAKRLDLTEGQLQLAGTLDPLVRFVAQNETNDYTIRVVIEGPVSAPEVVFESDPDLPQDEVLAQLFFERDIASLSAFQAAQMAAAVTQLTGDGSGGIAGQIRKSLGVDDLDVSQNSEGETSVRAGKYINDNVYTDVEVISTGETKFSINLDVTNDLTAKGSVSSEGNTSLGLYFQRDY
ncbi:translocation/assembly module TamB domain-containing protein [Pseudooceanicola nanhaiensis]|uniref:translocation/assembly module TamB domain-containing protein n=1 Tax=Pseudooceanicola nanhaiensis TaxID=375761 RepID=UPI001CD4EA06|nr:translocation/assembly module TamB domain-containing protein [Pseudooceanicola nanhaiensis]MCA0918912.1 translocation/assembly module TamB domain-containing protein [Pseudooceanicola nanhaiensis]